MFFASPQACGSLSFFLSFILRRYRITSAKNSLHFHTIGYEIDTFQKSPIMFIPKTYNFIPLWTFSYRWKQFHTCIRSFIPSWWWCLLFVLAETKNRSRAPYIPPLRVSYQKIIRMSTISYFISGFIPSTFHAKQSEFHTIINIFMRMKTISN